MAGEFYKAEKFSDRDLIESILNNYFIVDYGIITKVALDKTVSVQHATIPQLRDGTNLSPMQTEDIELLTLSCGDFSLNTGCKAGDKVLLLGLKTYVEKCADVKKASTMTSYAHYDRSTMKALPLCVFDDKAKIAVTAKDGTLDISCDKFTVSKNGIAALEVTP